MRHGTPAWDKYISSHPCDPLSSSDILDSLLEFGDPRRLRAAGVAPLGLGLPLEYVDQGQHDGSVVQLWVWYGMVSY